MSSEVAPLRAVLLAEPGPELAFDAPPDRWLHLDRVDPEAMRRETSAVAALYRSRGVEVRLYRPSAPPPPNFVFLRDLFFMTTEGAILCRMGAAQRAGEERYALEALASHGIPVVAAIRGDATFEGADALWLDEATVLVGVGRRTNRAGFVQVRRVLAEQGVRAVAVAMPRETQHLLGIVNFVACDLVVARRDRLSASLRQRLHAHGVRIVVLEPTDEVVSGRAMNFVTLAPMHVVMPAGAPGVRARLESHGVRCDEVCIAQYLRAAGGLGCLTGVIRRGG